MTDLLGCPFCGGKAERHDIDAREDVDNAGASYIECSRCGACTQLHFERKENLLDSWNSRAKEPAENEAARLRFDLRACRGRAEIDQRNLRHWREECGKLHAQVRIARDQRNEYQKKAQRARQHLVIFAEESNWRQGRRFDPNSATFDGISFANKGLDNYDPTTQPFDEPLSHVDPRVLVPVDPTPAMTEAAHKASLAADEPMSPDFPDLNAKIWRAMIMAGVAEQSGAGAPETSVRCGAPASNPCDTCGGSGEIFRGVGGPDDPERCHVCNGYGAIADPDICEDCPPIGYPTDETRCAPCTRRAPAPSSKVTP